MFKRRLVLMCSCFLAVGAVVGTHPAAAAEKPAAGRAAGAFIVDGKPFAFAYAYAQLEPAREGDDVLWVLLTEQPASADQLAGRFRDTAASDQLNSLAFALDAQNEPSDWRWSHPALSIGCALCSELKFQLSSRTRDEIGGTVFSEKTQTFQKQTYAFRASFAATIRRPSEPAGATKAQQAAIRELRRRGLAFRPADFYVFRTEPDVIRLFLDAGMKPDTLAPGATETLLLDVLGSDCSEPRVRSVALMLIAAGADPNRRSPNGSTPLTRAYNCPDVIDALLKAGAKAAEPAGRTPAPKPAPKTAPATRTPEQARQELARRKLALTEDRFWDRLTEFDTAATLLFLEAGISPNARRESPRGATPLLFVTQSGCAAPDATRREAAAEIALTLIAHKADVNLKSENDTTPLVHAAESCPVEVVRALLAAGAGTKAKARGGATAMLLAVLAGREDNVRALIDGGYDVRAELPSLLPLANGKPGIEAMLKKAAAGKLY